MLPAGSVPKVLFICLSVVNFSFVWTPTNLTNMKNTVAERELAFLSGGGEMGQLMRDFEWQNHPLGLPNRWPQSLKSILSVVLNSRFPQLFYWGKEMYFFYNDAYRPSLGNDGKHPASLGKPATEVFADIWHILKPIFEIVRKGETTGSEDQLIPVFRNGRTENVYWTYSHSPVRDESGVVNGIFVTCADTTKTVLTIVENQRNLDLAMETGGLGSYRVTLKTEQQIFRRRSCNGLGWTGVL